MLRKNEKKLYEFIKAHYMEFGEYPTFSKLMELMKYKSKRSISILIDSLIELKFLSKDKKGKFKLLKFNDSEHDETRLIPLLGLVSCGLPTFAEENIETHFSISRKFLKSNSKYFFLRAFGDSMDKGNSKYDAIEENDLVLIEVKSTAEDSEWVVALINNEATIKQLSIRHDHVLLKPSSKNSDNKPMILDHDFRIQGVVSKVFKGFDFY